MDLWLPGTWLHCLLRWKLQLKIFLRLGYVKGLCPVWILSFNNKLSNSSFSWRTLEKNPSPQANRLLPQRLWELSFLWNVCLSINFSWNQPTGWEVSGIRISSFPEAIRLTIQMWYLPFLLQLQNWQLKKVSFFVVVAVYYNKVSSRYWLCHRQHLKQEISQGKSLELLQS